jgi:hypothetical protein
VAIKPVFEETFDVRGWFGETQTAAGWFDRDFSEMISGGTTGQIKAWTGASWASKPVKVWNGTSWVTKPVKRWNGTSWVVTPY